MMTASLRRVAACVLVGIGTLTVAQTAPTSQLVPDEPLEDFDVFGWRVAYDGDRVLASALGDDGNRGAVYVFRRTEGGWTQEAKLVDRDRQPEAYFGTSIALEGGRVLVGSFGAPRVVRVFERGAGGWSQTATIENPFQDATGGFGSGFGTPVALSGTSALVGAPFQQDGTDTGAAYVFERTSTEWQRRATFQNGSPSNQPNRIDEFGSSVALEGDVAAVTAPSDGRVFLYSRDGAAWRLRQNIVGSVAPGSATLAFGRALALDGSRLLVGAPDSYALDGSFNGVSYVFERRGVGDWVETARIEGPAALNADAGYAVALSGDRALVSRQEGNDLEGPGVSAYALRGGSWVQTDYLRVRELGSSGFGQSVALSGATAVVGSPYVVVGGTASNAGAVYVYDLGEPTSSPMAPTPRSVTGPYPNPTARTSTVGLTLEVAQDVAVEVLDVVGRWTGVAWEGAVQHTADVPLDVGRLAPGVYIVRVVGQTFAEARPLVVAR